MNSIGLRHQCLCNAVAKLDTAISAISEASAHLSLDYREDARHAKSFRGMVSAYRKILAEKSLQLRNEIDGKATK